MQRISRKDLNGTIVVTFNPYNSAHSRERKICEKIKSEAGAKRSRSFCLDKKGVVFVINQQPQQEEGTNWLMN